jgi:hypothetical protein
LHDARPVAVRLDIRPRLRLSSEPPVAARRGFRLPALALPAAGYWVFMAALTYVFAHLGPHPLEAFAAEPTVTQRSQPTRPERPTEPERAPEPEPVTEVAPPALQASAEASPSAPALVDVDVDLEHEREREREPEPKHDRSPRREPASLSSEQTRLEAGTVAEGEPAPLPDPSVTSFPEFTDTSRAARRERGADGPRIDSVFEPAREQPAPSAPDVAPPERGPDAPIAVTSCEAAIARNNEQLTIGGPRRPADITREAYASILQNGRYLASCNLPDRTVIEICAAVRDGRAVGVTVVSNPPRAAVDACVRSAVARLAFPKNERLDVTHTRFDAVAR